jgi:nitrite reductase (NADH) large subunit
MAQAVSRSWRCSVCGYVHHGGAPPEVCPVCGAPSSDFEAFEEKPPTPVAPVRKSIWRCLVCGYTHEEAASPAECPLCGAGRESFETFQETTQTVPVADATTRLVVIGGGIAAVSAADAARRASIEAQITMISRERELPYYRLNLTRYLAGEIGDGELTIHPSTWYAEQKIEVLTGAEVESVSIDSKSIKIKGGKTIAYDKLVLATGAHAFLPPILGSDRKSVATLRTVENARRLVETLRPGLNCVCVGGGILGLETASALARRGADVTLLESHGYLMPRQLCRRAGEILKDFISGIGIQLREETHVNEITDSGVRLENGTEIPADLILFTIGVRSNSHLSRQAGLSVNTGILVDNYLMSTNPDIFAAGDSAEHNGILYGSWAAAQHQGSIAGMNAAGARIEFGGIPRSHTLKVVGLNLMSIGQFEPEDGSYRVIEDEMGGGYRRFVFRDSQMVGAILLGDTALATAVTKALKSREDFSRVLSGPVTAQAVVEWIAKQRVSTRETAKQERE